MRPQDPVTLFICERCGQAGDHTVACKEESFQSGVLPTRRPIDYSPSQTKTAPEDNRLT